MQAWWRPATLQKNAWAIAVASFSTSCAWLFILTTCYCRSMFRAMESNQILGQGLKPAYPLRRKDASQAQHDAGNGAWGSLVEPATARDRSCGTKVPQDDCIFFLFHNWATTKSRWWCYLKSTHAVLELLRGPEKRPWTRRWPFLPRSGVRPGCRQLLRRSARLNVLPER